MALMQITLTLLLIKLTRGVALTNLIDTLTANNATTFVSLLDHTGLSATLKSDGPLTVLAPTNEAFAKVPTADLDALKNDMNALKNVLKYHVVTGELFTWDLQTGERINTVNGQQIRVYESSDKHYFNNAQAVVEEIQATNGVVYLINEVLYVPKGTILDNLKNPDYSLSKFAGLVQDSQLESQFNSTTSTTRYTVFAPSDAAFAKLPAKIWNNLNASRIFLKNLVDYHTHRGTLHNKSFFQNGSISTLYFGHNILLSHDPGTGEVLLNTNGHVTLADIEAENGVVHVISHVLIPSTFVTIIG